MDNFSGEVFAEGRMSFAVVHMLKIGKGGLRGMQSHNQRERESRTNPDIDKGRSAQNYDLLNEKRINYNREVTERILRLAPETRTVRKDAVVLCNIIVSSDTSFFSGLALGQDREFFSDALRFFSERYGAAAIVNATVHMDEKTPHMHLGLVPIKNGRLSAKALFDRAELRSLQTDFVRCVGERYGLERGAEGSDRRHLSEAQFKVAMAEKEREKAVLSMRSAERARAHVEQQIDELKSIRGAVVPVRERLVGIGKGKRVEVTMEKATYDACVSAQCRADHAEMRAREAEKKNAELMMAGGAGENARLRKHVQVLKAENGRLRRDLADAMGQYARLCEIVGTSEELRCKVEQAQATSKAPSADLASER